jgi:hypothetical protein
MAEVAKMGKPQRVSQKGEPGLSGAFSFRGRGVSSFSLCRAGG